MAIEAGLELIFCAENEVKAVDQAADVVLHLKAEIAHEVEEKRRGVSFDQLQRNIVKPLKDGGNYFRI